MAGAFSSNTCAKRRTESDDYGLADVKMVRKSEENRDGGKTPANALKRDQIDASLKRVYDEMLQDEVPDRFEQLLRQLREQDDK